MSRFAEYAFEAGESLWRNRLRSALAILGMIIGTASIIAIIGTTLAAKSGIEATLAAFGDPGIFLAADPAGNDVNASRVFPRDAKQIVERNPQTIAHAYPGYERSFRVEGGKHVEVVSVNSATGNVIDRLALVAGRRINSGDVTNAAHVCLLTEDFATRLFGTSSVTGRDVRISGSRFRVVGVYAHGSNKLLTTLGGSDSVELPYTTFGGLAPGPVDIVEIYAVPGVEFEQASNAAIRTLKRIHGAQAQYVVLDNKAILERFDRVLGLLATGFAAIGAIALLVAGTGVMNVMLVSVTERTREIGLRKSIGASRGDIVLQFLFEAIGLSVIGGIAGTALGVGAAALASFVIERFVGAAPVPYASVVALAVLSSMLIGVVFGTYPALRASRMEPTAALRA